MQHLVDPNKIKPGGPVHMIPFTERPIDVTAAVEQIEAHPELWNVYTMRKSAYAGLSAGSPHSQVDDIWLRYRDIKDLKHRTPKQFTDQEHEAVFYPAWFALPALIPLVFGLANAILATRIGGMLITRIPATHRVSPHMDLGFNARHYRKFAIMLRSNLEQSFCFEGERMLTEAGEVFEFDNRFVHWVDNPSAEARMTLIVSLRTL
jgi:hypothetical protein